MPRRQLPIETLFASLADRTRLRLLNLLAEGDVCVCFFVDVLGEPQPKISRHLAYLRRAGLVAPTRDGKWIHYGLALGPPGQAGAILQTTLEALREDPEMRADRDRLLRVCCAPRLPAQLGRAPRPQLHSQRKGQ